MPHTVTWDAAYEAIPADTDLANTLGDVIRDLKRDIRERSEADHDWDDVTNAGQHKFVTLQEQGADPAAIADRGRVYTKDVGGITELFYRDSAGTIMQLTTNGVLNFAGDEITLDNDKALRGKDTGAVARNLSKVDASNRTLLGDTALATMRLQATTHSGVKAWDGATERDLIAYPKGYLSRLRIDFAADADHDLTIAIHDGRSSADEVNYAFSVALTKQMDVAWAAGNNQGGGIIGASTDAFIFVIFGASGTPIDAGFDTSATAVNLLAAAGGSYTKFREIGRLRTDTGPTIESFSYYKADGVHRIALSKDLAIASPVTWNHGLGVVPESVSVKLKCIVGDLSWVAGDLVDIASSANPANGSTVQWGSDATSIFVGIQNDVLSLGVLNKSTRAPQGITEASWRFSIRAHS